MEDAPRKEPKHKANFFDAVKDGENKISRRKRMTLEQADHEAAIARSGSFARPNPRAESKARDTAKALNSIAKRAAQSGARNAAAAAFNAAKTLMKATGAGADAMVLAEHGRKKAKDVKLRALAAAKARPPSHKLLSPSGGGFRGHSIFKLKGHDGDESYAGFLTAPHTLNEIAEDEDEAETEAPAAGGGGA